MFDALKRHKPDTQRSVSPLRNRNDSISQDWNRNPLIRSRSHSSSSSNSGSLSSVSTSSSSMDFTSSLTSSITNQGFYMSAEDLSSSFLSEHDPHSVFHNRSASDSFNSDFTMFSPSSSLQSPLLSASSGKRDEYNRTGRNDSVHVGTKSGRSGSLPTIQTQDPFAMKENTKSGGHLEKMSTGVELFPKHSQKPKEVSLHSNLTTNSNYRHSISFNKQQDHLYKIFLIGHIQQNGTGAELIGSPSKKTYISYIIEVHYQDRSILVQRRYSEFYNLYKYLKATYPKYNLSIPPKQFLNNMSQQTIEKRKQGLKQLLWEVKQICGYYSYEPTNPSDNSIDSCSINENHNSRDINDETRRERAPSKNSIPGLPFMWYHDPAIKKFFCLNRFQSGIYQVPNHVWHHIFEYLGFNDLYRNVALTSKWITRILYINLSKVTFSFLNQEIYFQNVAIAVDTIEELYDLSIRFSGLQHIVFERFNAIHNSFLERLVKQKSGVLRSLEVRRCNVVKELNLSGGGEQLQRISFAYCQKLEKLALSTIGHEVSRCRYLDLSATRITDATLRDTVRCMPNLEYLIIRSCSNLVEPSFETAVHSFSRLHTLDFSFCSNLKSFTIGKAKRLEMLRVEYTAITNKCLQTIVNSCESLQCIIANGCSNITSLIVPTSSQIQQLQFSCCTNLDPSQWKISSPLLQTVDFRLTPINSLRLLNTIVDLEVCEQAFSIGYVDENDPTLNIVNVQNVEPFVEDKST